MSSNGLVGNMVVDQLRVCNVCVVLRPDSAVYQVGGDFQSPLYLLGWWFGSADVGRFDFVDHRFHIAETEHVEEVLLRVF